MSVIWKSDEGCLISHDEFIRRAYRGKHRLDPLLFDVHRPYKLSKKGNASPLDAQVSKIQHGYNRLIDSIKQNNLLTVDEINLSNNNQRARSFADECIRKTVPLTELQNLKGGNTSDCITYPQISECKLIIPENCSFIYGDVRTELARLIGEYYDLVILDPPWWNKYIRRKRKRHRDDSYDMLYNDDVSSLPINRLLSDEAVVAVWCTNCLNHENDIKDCMFPKWNVEYVATWYWMKVTKNGEPVCPFTKSNGKQPFERLIIGVRNLNSNRCKLQEGRIFMSIPSVLHSHKPPLNDLLLPYLTTKEPKCLELFARYLLPKTTSIGFEPLRWQHEYLYTNENI